MSPPPKSNIPPIDALIKSSGVSYMDVLSQYKGWNNHPPKSDDLKHIRGIIVKVPCVSLIESGDRLVTKEIAIELAKRFKAAGLTLEGDGTWNSNGIIELHSNESPERIKQAIVEVFGLSKEYGKNGAKLPTYDNKHTSIPSPNEDAFCPALIATSINPKALTEKSIGRG